MKSECIGHQFAAWVAVRSEAAPARAAALRHGYEATLTVGIPVCLVGAQPAVRVAVDGAHQLIQPSSVRRSRSSSTGRTRIMAAPRAPRTAADSPRRAGVARERPGAAARSCSAPVVAPAQAAGFAVVAGGGLAQSWQAGTGAQPRKIGANAFDERMRTVFHVGVRQGFDLSPP